MHGDSHFKAILQPADISVSGNRADDSLGIDFTDAIVVAVGKN